MTEHDCTESGGILSETLLHFHEAGIPSLDASGIALSVIVFNVEMRSMVLVKANFERMCARDLCKMHYGIYLLGGMQ